MSEIHAVDPGKVVKEILDHVWHNVRETFAVKDTGIFNVDTVHAVYSVDKVNSVTLSKLTLKIPARHLSGIL